MKRLVLVTGPVGGGKTTRLMSVTDLARDSGASVGGLLAPRVVMDGVHVGYDAVDVGSGERRVYIRRANARCVPTVGPWSFDAGGLAFARCCVLQSYAADLVVVDELGPLELSGGGLATVVSDVMQRIQKDLFISVRESIVEEVKAWLRVRGVATIETQKVGDLTSD
jgi:nucleoside-triphosphatase THEP1